MSYAYYVDKNGKVTKGSKKKKKQTEYLYTVDSKGKVTKNNTTEDIAPVKSKKKEKKDTWFKAGGFSDGVDSVGDFFGDLGETVVGTVGDVGVGLGKGLTRMGEGIGDALRYGVAGVADLTGNDNYAERLRKSAKENDTDDIWRKAEKKVDKNSVLGNKSDKVTEGLGQVAGIILTGGAAGALGAGAGVATAITTGTVGISGIGSGISEAYQSGATDKQAYTYGTIAGVGEALTELVFGGLGKTVKATGLSKGLSSADDMLAKKVSGMFNNQIAKNFAEFGIKSGAEGTEEVLSGIISAVGKKVTYMEEEELSKILEDEDLLEQFVVGSITSGIAQSGVVPAMRQGSLIEANKQGKDFITGLTTNEQKVVDKEFENRISEAEKDGKKLSEKDKTKIYDEVLNDLDKGYISTDTIESAIGDKTYETYKTMEEQENSLKKEIESLENTPKEQFTVKQDERLKELREELAKIDKTQIKNQLSSEVSELAKVDRLSESYNEKARRSQTFEADLTKYDTKQQEVIKKATESGILNNTNRTHEFVDMVAKISADKGVLFDFTNNQKLKDSGFAVEGKTVNGYKTKDGNIGINIDSHKSLNSVVGHEITHVLEGTELYTELQEAVTNYAKTKGDYDTRYNELAELYKDIEDDIEGEVTADLVGDYLFTDKDFVNNLSVEKPNIFKKIFNEIKYLYKMATAGSKEARQLEKVKRTFENAYRQTSSNTNIDTKADTKYSVSDNIKNVESYADEGAGESIFRTNWLQNNQKMVDEIVKNRPKTETDNFKAWFNTSKATNRNGEPLLVFHGTKGRFTNFDSNGKAMWFSANPMYAKGYSEPTKISDKVTPSGKIFGGASERLIPSYIRAENPADFGNTDLSFEEAVSDVSSRLEIPENELKSVWEQVGKPNELWKVVHSSEMVELLKDYGFDSVQAIEGGSRTWGVFESNQVKSAVANKGTFDNENSDIRYSLSDSDGKTLTKEQQEYFKDSKVRDENGNLKVMYHGTSNGGHTVFDIYGSNFGLFGQGTYFTDNKSVAESYTDKGKGNNKQVYEAYLNIKNPMDMDAEANIEEWQKAFPEADFPENGTNEDCFKAMKEYFFDNEYTKSEAYEEAMDAIIGMGYDGLTHIGGGRFNKADDTRHRVYIAYEPEQIKNIDNTKPTSDADIRFSLSKKGEQLAPYGNFNIYGKDVALQPKVEDEAPVQENVEKGTVEEKTNDVQQSQEEFERVVQSYMDDAPAYMFDEDEIRAWAEEQARQNPQGIAPKENTAIPESPLAERDIETIGRDRKTNAYMYENPEVKPFFQEEAMVMLAELGNSTKGEKGRKGASYGLDEYETGAGNEGWFGTKRQTSKEIAELLDSYDYSYKDIEKGLRAIIEDNGAENNAISKRIEFKIDERLREGYDYFGGDETMPPNQEYINLLNEKQITEYSDEAFNNWAGSLKEDIAPVEENVEQNLYSMEDSKNNEINELDTKVEETEKADEPELTVNESFDAKINNYKDAIKGYKDSRVEIENAFDEAIENKTKEYEALKRKDTKKATNLLMQIENFKLRKANNLSNIDSRIEKTQTRIDNMIKNSETIKQGMYGKRRKALHIERMDEIKAKFLDKGFDFDTVLKNAKNKSTFSSVDNTPQRFMEKTLGYKEGQILADITVNKVAQNESAGIRWVNENVSLLKQISKEYGIKPRSKESAAAQMYAEGFYVNENDKLVKYGEKELALDFEDAEVRANIKKLAKDPRIRSIYDETLDQINKSRIRNAYPEIPKRDNYFLHFIEMDDAFSRLGIPFNPNDIRAKDLPTDLNGVTVDLKPGQPYFASQMHRKGHKTTYDLLGGVEKYLNSAKNQIYHIDDIQTLRATRNYIADMFGQAKGLEDLDTMTETEAAERIEKVFGSHLSNFAKFLHEEANVIAGKTALIDRGLEGIIGRKGITFLNTLNGQVGSNMVGFNASSSLTNFVSVMQSMAKSSKADTLKAFTQTVSNKIGSVFGRTDGFADNNPAIIRRKGIDTFARKPYEKISDSGYLFMSAIDDISTEIIVRTKFNELTRKGMSEEQAHIESDKWAHRILGDRSLGQQPLLYNSKMLGILTKFQLEVRNQLDSQFYDTIQEAKVSTEEIDNEIQKNAVKAAKIGSTMLQLAVLQHVFGKAFESVAGYNPAFDIIEVLMTTLGYDDEEDSEDTKLDNIEQGFLALLEDLPYSSILTGGRIPISSALPIKELVTGKDSYGQEKPRLETLKEVAPYYLLPTGYGQIKKTKQGLDMFSDEHPVSGSYTDKGDLRFPIDDTTQNRLQAGIFGQYANDNARYYFDNDIAPLNKKQTQEFIDVDMPIKDYWNYRDEMKGKKKIDEKADYISNLELPVDKKNILINNATTRKEPIDMTDYEDYSSFNEFDFANKYPKKYKLLQDNNVSFEEYSKNEDTKAEYNWAFRNPKKYKMLQENNVSYKEYAKNEETKDAYDWAFRNPEKYTLSKAISSNLVTYRKYSKDIYNIRADKDKYGKSISGTKKKKVLKYINDLDADYGEKLILFKSVYDYDDTYNQEIVDYLNNREDITYDDMNTTLKELGFTVTADGTIYWN